MPFSSLGLSASVIRGLTEVGYVTPTPVQLQAIPAVLAGGDVVALARTGTGKTAAYVLPILQMWADRPRIKPRRLHGLVLVPTRELAAQVGETFRSLSRFLPGAVKTVVVAGGGSLNPQRMALRGGADIVVATPGRLLDIAQEHTTLLQSVHTLVLDEADKLLSLGFADELNRILDLLPAKRQSLFFSATFPDSVQALVDTLVTSATCTHIDARDVDVSEENTTGLAAVEQRAIQVDAGRRTQLLLHVLKEQPELTGVLVFVATKYGADHVTTKLTRAGVAALSIHGDLSQGARNAALSGFKRQEVRVLVATDLAARGIDIPDLACVVNFDLPRSPSDYLHRIGRTGRAGASGLAISFVSPEDEAHFNVIEKHHGLYIAREQIAGFEVTETTSPVVRDLVAADGGGIKGRRKSKKDKLREAARRDDEKAPEIATATGPEGDDIR